MADITGKIQTLHILFVICVVLTVICFIIAIALFFALNIKNVIGYLSGRTKKRGIEQLQQSSAESGRLSRREKNSIHYMNKEVQADMGLQGGAQTMGARKVENVVQQVETNVPQPTTYDTAPTGILSTSDNDSTTMLNDQTTLLSEKEKPKQEASNGETIEMSSIKKEVLGSFTIEKEIIFIHTDEII